MQTVHWADLFLSMDRFLVEMAHHYGPFVYLALGLIFLMQTGLVFMAFLPGDSLVLGTLAGNLLNFSLGVWLGRKVFDGDVRWVDRKSLNKTLEFFERHGGKTVIVALFLPL